MNVKINIHKENSDIESRIELLKNWRVPEDVRKDVVNFLEDLGDGLVNKGVRVSDRTKVKYISLLKIPLTHFNKKINKITYEDVKEFSKELDLGKIRKLNKNAYAHSVKIDIFITLKVFLTWKLGLERSRILTDFLDVREKKKTPDYLKESEVEKLFKSCRFNHERFAIAILFDSGARAEEFLNIRYEDIQMPEGKDNYIKITLKGEYSKTDGRTISLYWKYSFESVRDYLQDRLMEGISSKDAIFVNNYDSLRAFLRRLGIRTLGKTVYPHLFRHSSATYYASKMNRQELCYRYGWKFSSDMPDVYISRAGIISKELDNKMSAPEINLLKDEIDKLKLENELMKKSMKRIEKKAEFVKQQFRPE